MLCLNLGMSYSVIDGLVAALQSFSPALRALFLQFDSLVVIEGVLYRLFYDECGSQQFYQVILPHTMKRDFLQLIHNDFCNHLGAAKNKQIIKQYAYWFRWQNDVQLYVKACNSCSAYHHGKAPKPVSYTHLTLPTNREV